MHSQYNPDRLTLDACAVLEVAPSADAEEIRKSYLRKVQENPPERCPDAFEKIRDAYRLLSDERRLFLTQVFSGNPHAPMVTLLEGDSGGRNFVGPEKWLRVIREASS